VRQDDYKVELDVFEGPLDLLLYLIKRDELDIYDIPIERITKQYMDYLDLMRMLDLNIAGDFLVMAATLMMIKSRMLLPVDARPETEEEEEDDPRWDLVRQLVEYKKFKDAAMHLEERETVAENLFAREGEGVQLDQDAEMVMQDVSIFDLISAFSHALSRVENEDLKEIFQERFTVAEKIDAIVRTLDKKDMIRFSDMFSGITSRGEIVCIFLALLELIRLKQVRAVQDQPLGEIVIMHAEGCEP
jgi:segregation and condensation protein A